MSTSTLNEKYYAFVIIDDFSRFTWVLFLTHKSEAFNFFKYFCKRVEKKISSSIIKIHSDRGEFENKNFIEFCFDHGIAHTFLAPIILQQNCVVEKKNRTLQKMTRTMLNSFVLPKYFWRKTPLNMF